MLLVVVRVVDCGCWVSSMTVVKLATGYQTPALTGAWAVAGAGHSRQTVGDEAEHVLASFKLSYS
jgi:hypothetical protein